MKFLHVTDTHLGKTESRIRERELDFYNSFKQAVDYALEKKVDFVIHSGDLFDVARPMTRTLIFAVQQLMRLKEANISVYIAAGSHDIGVEDTIISVLEAIGLLKNLSAARYYKTQGDKIVMDGEMFRDIFICGLAGKRENISDVYEKLQPARKGKYNIFIFHHAISDISEKFADITTSLLPKGFDYYAAGHWHGFFETKYDRGIVVYPGSTDFNDLTEMENHQEKYFCIVDTETKKYEKIRINTRPIVSVSVNCAGCDAKEVSQKTIMSIPPSGDQAILIIKLNGKLGKGTKSGIDRNIISESAKSSGYLYTKIYLSELENPEAPFVSTERKTVSEIEEEYLKKQKYDDASVNVAKQMITLFGKKLSPAELKARQKAAVEIVRGFLVDTKTD
ncbi:MAG: DNA repair exonuclease [Candidatus Nanoarchaeia archaeon]|nr:DNA repair exonuclease [Candidatus Nanoarchaeia archaeon]MDD5239385.1 DNA repair exonuclease [Candidatus Nanoarchaeia archaeon]